MKYKLMCIITIIALVPFQSYAGKYDGIAGQITDFLGGGGTVVRNDSNAYVAVGKNNNKLQFHYDGHGNPPHAHLQVQNANGKYVDAPGAPHRIPLREDSIPPPSRGVEPASPPTRQVEPATPPPVKAEPPPPPNQRTNNTNGR